MRAQEGTFRGLMTQDRQFRVPLYGCGVKARGPLILGLCLFIGGCGTTGESQSGSGGSSSSKTSVAEKLATIQKHAPVEAGDPLVARFDRELDALQGKCKDRRLRLADFTVKAQELLKKDGVSESLSSIITHVNQSIPENYPGKTCADLFAAYVTLRTRG